MTEHDQPLDEEAALMDAAAARARAIELRAQTLRIDAAARRLLAREHQGDQPRPQLIRLDRFLDETDNALAYRVDKLWPTGGRVLLAARGKAGKTTLLGNLIRSLVDADPFLETFDTKPVGHLVLIDNELDHGTLRRWLRAQNVVNQSAVVLLPLRGQVTSFDILDPVTRSEWAKEIAGAEVVLLDCLRPILDAFGLDENHEAGRFLVAFDAFLKDAGASEAAISHHMGYGPERARGDSRLSDWPDAIWQLVRDKTEDDETLDDMAGARYFSAYGRDVEQAQAELTYDPDTRHLALGNLARNRRQATESRKTTKADTVALAVVAQSPGITKRLLRDRCATEGVRHPEADSAVERLVAAGLITRMKAGNAHLHYPGTGLQDPTVPTVPNRALGTAGTSVPVPMYMGTDTHAHQDTLDTTQELGTTTTTKPCPNCTTNQIPEHHHQCPDCAQQAINQARAK